MDLSIVFAGLGLIATCLGGPYAFIFFKDKIEFEGEKLEIMLTQKTDMTNISFSEFSSIKMHSTDSAADVPYNHDAFSLFFSYRALHSSMAVLCMFFLILCVSGFLSRALTEGEEIKTALDFVISAGSVAPSSMIVIGSCIVFFITIALSYHFKNLINTKIQILKKYS